MHFSTIFAILFISSTSSTICARASTSNDEEYGFLSEMIDYMRKDDHRLVRFNVPDEKAVQRQEKACSIDLDAALDVLISGLPSSASDEKENAMTTTLEDRIKAVQVVALCTNSNPKYRKHIGTYEDSSVIKALISVINDVNSYDEKQENEGDLEQYYDQAAAAGEAIWIMTFNNSHNHQTFLSNQAVPVLSKLVIDYASQINSETHDDESPLFASINYATMWAAAALQNLAASYCDTESGHCWWELDESHALVLHPESPLTIDGNPAREEMLEQEGLIPALKTFACLNNGEPELSFWPSEASVWNKQHVSSPRIVSWAAAGALKNIALSRNFELDEDIKECLCSLKLSPDWLESSKAADALYRSAVTC